MARRYHAVPLVRTAILYPESGILSLADNPRYVNPSSNLASAAARLRPCSVPRGVNWGTPAVRLVCTQQWELSLTEGKDKLRRRWELTFDRQYRGGKASRFRVRYGHARTACLSIGMISWPAQL